jgi:transposase
MKQIKEVVGIDASKDKLDVFIHVKKLHQEFGNGKNDFKRMVSWVKTESGLDLDEIFLCFEHTGVYTIPLATYLATVGIRFAMVPALEIKKSMGMTRGKNDKVDSRRIAEFAYLRRESIKQTVLPSKTLQKIKALVSTRDQMVASRTGYVNSIQQYKFIMKSSDCPTMFKELEKQTKGLTASINVIENEILSLIKGDEQLHQLYKLIVSIKGIGPVIAVNLLLVTNCFTAFETSRKLACYCGTAPFERQSGTSLRAKSRVSHYANKRMKALLNLAAGSAIQSDPELKQYYLRRLSLGKSKMSTLNIVRNKLLHRVFAVVKRQTPFVEIGKWAA